MALHLRGVFKTANVRHPFIPPDTLTLPEVRDLVEALELAVASHVGHSVVHDGSSESIRRPWRGGGPVRERAPHMQASGVADGLSGAARDLPHRTAVV